MSAILSWARHLLLVVPRIGTLWMKDVGSPAIITICMKEYAPHIAVFAGGYSLKNISPERIIEGIRTVHRGDLLIHPDVARKLATLVQGPRTDHSADSRKKKLEAYHLTPAEQQIVELIAEGKSNKEIAQTLFLSEGTIKNYITEILSKLSFT